MLGFVGNILNYLNPFSEDFILKGLLDLIGNILDYLNPFSDNFILRGVLSFLGDILSYLNPFSDNFILKGVLDFLGNILSYLNPFSDNFLGKKIIELLSDLLEFLFIPSEERFTSIQTAVSSKFGFVDTIKNTINEFETVFNNIENSPKMDMEINSKYYSGKLTVVDMSWYAPFKPYGDLVITGFVYVFFLWRMFIHIPNIINGAGGIIDINYKE